MFIHSPAKNVCVRESVCVCVCVWCVLHTHKGLYSLCMYVGMYISVYTGIYRYIHGYMNRLIFGSYGD
uniref:Uncharacterized protein n=1 Tax=Anguilla anguilla TaxID=7936 RepID=A0A0E9WXG8_ANGAN